MTHEKWKVFKVAPELVSLLWSAVQQYAAAGNQLPLANAGFGTGKREQSARRCNGNA
jgi:hypothetical protein